MAMLKPVKNNEHLASSWFNNLDALKMEKWLSDIAAISGATPLITSYDEGAADQPWFEDISDAHDINLDDDADETLLAATGL